MRIARRSSHPGGGSPLGTPPSPGSRHSPGPDTPPRTSHPPGPDPREQTHLPCGQNHRRLWKYNLAPTSLRTVIIGCHPQGIAIPMRNPRSELAVDIRVFRKFIIWEKSHYRPQRSWAKVMFLQASVILLTGGGVPGQVPPGPGTSPRPGTPPTRYSPLDQVLPPLDQVLPPRPGTPPQTRYPQTRYSPPETRYSPLHQVPPPAPGTPPLHQVLPPPETRYPPDLVLPPGTRYPPDQVPPLRPGTPPDRYPLWDQVPPPGTGTPPGPGTIRPKSGRYASYWNAYLFKSVFSI